MKIIVVFISYHCGGGGGGGLVAKSCPTLATPWTIICQALLSMGILQARLLEWFAISFSTNTHKNILIYPRFTVSSFLFQVEPVCPSIIWEQTAAWDHNHMPLR